jgi:hypothetical protein
MRSIIILSAATTEERFQMAESIPRIPASRAQSRPAVIIAALLYLIAAYQRTPCPCLAGCIVRHLECLIEHEAAEPVIQQICAAIRGTWIGAACGEAESRVH